MDKNDEEKYVELKGKVVGESNLSADMLVATSTELSGEVKVLAYGPKVKANEIVRDVAEFLNWDLQPEYMEVIVETVERSKGLGSGIRLSAGFRDVGNLDFEKKPQKEVKTIEKVIWRRPKST